MQNGHWMTLGAGMLEAILTGAQRRETAIHTDQNNNNSKTTIVLN